MPIDYSQEISKDKNQKTIEIDNWKEKKDQEKDMNKKSEWTLMPIDYFQEISKDKNQRTIEIGKLKEKDMNKTAKRALCFILQIL